MAELEIPGEAIGLASRGLGDHGQTLGEVVFALHVAAPLIVAAALDRLADEWSDYPVSDVMGWLRERAAELRQGDGCHG